MTYTLNTRIYVGFFLLLFVFAGCKKETITIEDNDPPSVNYVPQIRIESYVNRVFIDLIGREPLDSEMASEVAALKATQIATASRSALINKLQNNTDFIEGDTSYYRAYHQHLYNQAKIRCIEGASDMLIEEFINDTQDELVILRLSKVFKSREEMQNGAIEFNEMFGRMVSNAIYDQINMNSFNFVNATFDNLFWRFPTDAEFDAGFSMVENNSSASLFGVNGQTKDDYVNILINSTEMYEGMIIWVYQQLLSRRPTTEETVELLEDFVANKKIQDIQHHIMITDEYANF